MYDDENRPTSISYPGGADTFLYNALGQRMRATLTGATRRYVYHGDRVLEETDDGGVMQGRYTTESGSYYAPMWHIQRADGTSRFPLYDGIGSARRLVDAAGVKSDGYNLDAFGRVFAAPTQPTPNPYRFGGAWGYITDTPGSGLLQLGARFYWPEVGRFVQQDPLWAFVNGYVYADKNPLREIDPEGLSSFRAISPYLRGRDPIGLVNQLMSDEVAGLLRSAEDYAKCMAGCLAPSLFCDAASTGAAAGASSAIGRGAASKASRYAAAKGLICPGRSSIYRGIIAGGKSLAGKVSAVTAVAGLVGDAVSVYLCNKKCIGGS